MKNEKFRIVAEQSNIAWIGRKITGAHNGTIAINDGVIVLNDGKLVAGTFVADTTSIKILDITDPVTNKQFAGHLASEDFFASEQYPESLFMITSVEPGDNNRYHINGDLTIKGVTNPVVFDAALDTNGDILTASGKITVDRTRYGMKFRSGNFFKDLGETLIYNDFDLNVSITARAVREPAWQKTEDMN